MEGACPVADEFTLVCDSIGPNKSTDTMSKRGTRPVAYGNKPAYYSVIGKQEMKQGLYGRIMPCDKRVYACL